MRELPESGLGLWVSVVRRTRQLANPPALFPADHPPSTHKIRALSAVTLLSLRIHRTRPQDSVAKKRERTEWFTRMTNTKRTKLWVKSLRLSLSSRGKHKIRKNLHIATLSPSTAT